MRCLLVDDEPGIREGLAALLRKKGHDVRTAGDCASARGALTEDFDVVVTDWRLPDGTAASFWHGARCPILVVSGHPEEVDGDPRVRQVMTKPVSPTRLSHALLELGPAERGVAPQATMPYDVQRAIDAFLGQLPAAAVIEMQDDGTFVTIVATMPTAARPALAGSDGELVWSTHDGRTRARLRLHRDGRPGVPMPILGAAAEWPGHGEFAVDFHDTTGGPVDFLRCLDRARTAKAEGCRVHFLNVPSACRDVASSHGRAHDMPMRDPVGPRLQAEFADLWRDP